MFHGKRVLDEKDMVLFDYTKTLKLNEKRCFGCAETLIFYTAVIDQYPLAD